MTILHRYVEKNVKAHSLYRGYSPDIPQYLHDRPHHVVKHCMSKIHLAEEFSTQQVLQKGDSGIFQVESLTEKKVWYTVRYDDPSCSCKSWQHNHLPCKHFFAVFRHYPEWGWDKLPLVYTCSPTLTLDENVIPKQNITDTESTQAAMDVTFANAQEPDTILHSLDQHESSTFRPATNAMMPVRKHALRNIGSECREILNEMKSMSYLVGNYNDLSALKEELIKLRERMSGACPSDCGLLLESTKESEPHSKKRKTKCQENSKKQDVYTYGKIPKQESRKHKYAGRVGSKASMMKRLYKTKKNPMVDLSNKENETKPTSVTNVSTTTTSGPNSNVEIRTPCQSINTYTVAMEVPEWGGSITMNDRKTSMVNTCPIDNWLVITYIILQLYPVIYKVLSSMVACPGAKTMLRLHHLYKQKKFNEAKWYLAQLNGLPANATNEGNVVDFFGREHNQFVRHLAPLFRHTSVSRCSNKNCPHKTLITDSSSNPTIVQTSGTSNNIQHSLAHEIKSWFESEFQSQCLLKLTDHMPDKADIYIMNGTSM